MVEALVNRNQKNTNFVRCEKTIYDANGVRLGTIEHVEEFFGVICLGLDTGQTLDVHPGDLSPMHHDVDGDCVRIDSMPAF